ncbi:MAG: hypothetical protein U0798_06650 [Gemmataceae bacterium]
MQLYCPTCEATFTGKRDCPHCGVRLIAPGQAHVLPTERVLVETENTSISLASRVLAGGIAAVGLSLGCREILAGFLPLFGETDAWLASDYGLVLLFFVRIMSGLLAGVLAGAGHEKSVVGGLMAGCAGAAVLQAIHMFEPGAKLSIGSVVLTLAVVGMAVLSGWISGKIWPSRSELPKATYESNGSSLLEQAHELQQQEEAKKQRPTQWIRIILAISLTVCAFVGAEGVRNFLAKKSDGLIDMGGSRNIPIMCLQIATLGIMLSGVVAGASTGAGFRHGVYTGLIAGGLIAALYIVRGPDLLKPVLGLMEALSWPVDKVPPVRVASAIFGGIFTIHAFSGLFGGMLFPPMSARRK